MDMRPININIRHAFFKLLRKRSRTKFSVDCKSGCDNIHLFEANPQSDSTDATRACFISFKLMDLFPAVQDYDDTR